MPSFIIYFNFYIFFTSNTFTNAGEEIDNGLIFVQTVFRHGDRTPAMSFPTDPYSKDIWKEGTGELTLLGKKQMYMLGKLFRQMYEEFITTNPREVNATSSESNRCIESAEATLASFYAPSAKWQFDSDVNWQPISVRYLPADEDKYLIPYIYCPKASEEQERVMNSVEGQKFIKENQKMFQYLSKHSGMSISWGEALILYDTLQIEKNNNLELPTWTRKYWKQLANTAEFVFHWLFNSPLLRRLRGGPLVGLIKDNMQKKMSNELPLTKVQLYSAHDITVAALLQALNLYNMKRPPYASAVVVELHNFSDGYHVRLLYFNSTTPELGEQTPHVLVLDGCNAFCPFEYFEDYTKDVVPSDWEAECKPTLKEINRKSKREILKN